MTSSGPMAIRGRVLTFSDDPAVAGDRDSYRYLEDGLLILADGRIRDMGEAGPLLATLPAGAAVHHYPGALIMAGFIDAHIHYPQTQVIASYGAQLLDWLETYTYVEEQKFADPVHAGRIARFFLDELCRSGTTTAAVYCTVHPSSVDVFFAESARRNMRMVAGKVLMDRNAPDGLLDSAERAYAESEALIARWHGQGRQHYAVTPRFAITSTEAQLEAAGALLRAHPDALLQTHLSENPREIEMVRTLFPGARSYTDVYDRAGLLGPRSLFGHCLHLDDAERARLSETGSVAAVCPTSNLFIGSGLFDWRKAQDARWPLRLALGTDVGGGTSFSLLRTAGAAYKVAQLRGHSLPPVQAFYMLTLGNARALGLDQHIGTLAPGTDADVVVLDARATPAMAHRMETAAGDLARELFVLMTLGDDRAVRATYVAGSLASGAAPGDSG